MSSMLRVRTRRRATRSMRRLRRSQSTPPPSWPSAAASDTHRSMLELAEHSLRCVEVAPRAASAEDGVTTALSIESAGRADVLDLDRVFFMGDGGTVDVSWLGLPAAGGSRSYQLLLQVAVTSPTECRFVVNIPVDEHDGPQTLRRLSYLLAADRLAVAFDGPVTTSSAILIAAPADRRPLLAAIDCLRDAVGVAVSARARG